MDNENRKWICIDCIWHDQCGDSAPCDFFDNGKAGSLPDNDEIEMQIEIGRKQFVEQFNAYAEGW